MVLPGPDSRHDPERVIPPSVGTVCCRRGQRAVSNSNVSGASPGSRPSSVTHARPGHSCTSATIECGAGDAGGSVGYHPPMSRPLSQLWLDVLRPPSGFTLSSTVLALVDARALRARAPGELKRPETIDFQTAVPVRDGLFCERIFGEGAFERGPFADDELVTEARATRFGRIVLPAPVVHPLALAHAPDDIAERARISRAELDELTAHIDPGRWARLGELLARTEEGAAVLLHELPVLPPYLRPMKLLDGGDWTIAGLNDLYRSVVNRAFRLRRLCELEAPDVITANEYKMMARAIHALFENEDCPEPITDHEARPYVSLRTLGVGNRLFEALTELDRRHALGVAPDGPLTRTLHHPIAALHAMGLELRRSCGAGPGAGRP